MRNAKYIPFVAFVTLGLLSCYNPLLPDDPFFCGEGGKCPDDYKCYGGTCLKDLPACMDSSHPDYQGWPSDHDLEPNNNQDMAIVLPCGDDAVFTNPLEYASRCNRQDYTNAFTNLLICPNGDRDYYAIYMLPDEEVAFKITFMHNLDPPRNLDATVWRWDFVTETWISDIVQGRSTNDNEEFELSTASGSGNPQGWYYLEIFGATYQDVNYYMVGFTLNASHI